MTVTVPDDPAVYFREFFPERFRELRERFPPGDSAAAAAFELDDGRAWTFRVRDGALEVDDGVGDDVVMRLATSPGSFHALFVDRTREEVRKKGALMDGSKAALKPLFLTDHKRQVCSKAKRGLTLELLHRKQAHPIAVTPGPADPERPGATVRMKIEDYLEIQTGKRNPKMLFVTGRLKIRGDLQLALQLQPLLS